MNLAYLRSMGCLQGCLATLSVLVVRIVLLEYSKTMKRHSLSVWRLLKCVT